MVAKERYLILAVEETASLLGFYDSHSGKKVAQLKLGLWPHEIAISPDQKTAYVTNFSVHDYDLTQGYAGNSISVIDIATKCERDRLYTADSDLDIQYWAPHGIKVSPDGKYLYVNVERTSGSRNPEANAKSGQEKTKLLVFDLKAKKIIKQFNYNIPVDTEDSDLNPLLFAYDVLPGTHNFVFSPDGKHLWLSSGITGISRMDPLTGKITARLTDFNGAVRGLSFNQDGSLLVSATNEVSFVDPESLKIIKKIGNLGVGQILYSKATNDGKYILAPAVWEGEVLVIDVSAEKVIKSISSGIDPIQIVISPDGKKAIVTHGRSNWMVEIDLSDFTITRQIETVGGPNGALYVPFQKEKIKKTMKFAACLPFTGKFSKFGREMRLGYQFWQDNVNDSGGLYFDNNSYKVEIEYLNTESNCDLNYLESHISDFIDKTSPHFILGTYGDEANEVVAKIAENKDFLNITSTSFNPELFEKDYRNTFAINNLRNGALNEAISAIFSHTSPKAKDLVILSSSDTYMLKEAYTTLALAKKRNLNILSGDIIQFENTPTSIEQSIQKISALTPDIIMILANTIESINIINSCARLDLTPGAFILNCDITFQSFIESLGNLSNNLIGLIEWSKSLKNSGQDRFVCAEDFGRNYFDSYNEKPSSLAAGSAATGVIYEKLIRSTNSLDIASLRARLLSFNFPTFYSWVNFNNKGFNIKKEMLVVQIQQRQGKISDVIVWPKKFAHGNNIVWPFPEWEQLGNYTTGSLTEEELRIVKNKFKSKKYLANIDHTNRRTEMV